MRRAGDEECGVQGRGRGGGSGGCRGAGWRRCSGGRKMRRRLCTGEKGVAAVERETSGLGLGLRVGVVL